MPLPPKFDPKDFENHLKDNTNDKRKLLNFYMDYFDEGTAPVEWSDRKVTSQLKKWANEYFKSKCEEMEEKYPGLLHKLARNTEYYDSEEAVQLFGETMPYAAPLIYSKILLENPSMPRKDILTQMEGVLGLKKSKIKELLADVGLLPPSASKRKSPAETSAQKEIPDAEIYETKGASAYDESVPIYSLPPRAYRKEELKNFVDILLKMADPNWRARSFELLLSAKEDAQQLLQHYWIQMDKQENATVAPSEKQYVSVYDAVTKITNDLLGLIDAPEPDMQSKIYNGFIYLITHENPGFTEKLQ